MLIGKRENEKEESEGRKKGVKNKRKRKKKKEKKEKEEKGMEDSEEDEEEGIGKKRKKKEVEKEEDRRRQRRILFQPTWDPCHSSVQPGSSCSDLVGPSLSQGPHSELEGAPGDVLAPVFNVNSMSSHLLRDEADAVGAVLSFNDLCVLRLSSRTRHQSCHLLVTCLT